MDYKKGKIYGIRNKVNDKMYIGSTIRTLSDRWCGHKGDSQFKEAKLYVAMRELGVDKFEIYLIEKYPCSSRKELLARESHFIRENNSIENGYNMYLTGRTKEERKMYKAESDRAYRAVKGKELLEKKKEYYEQNKERCKDNSKRSQERRKEERREYMKQYAEQNKDKLLEYRQNYYEGNKDKILEQCKEYREAHKKEKAERDRKYCENNVEKVKQNKKKYYDANKDKWELNYNVKKDQIASVKKEYYAKNKEKINAKHPEWVEKNRERIREADRRRYQQKKEKQSKNNM